MKHSAFSKAVWRLLMLGVVAFLGAMSAFAYSPAGALVYHSTMDSNAAVESPRVGGAGSSCYAYFQQGVEGNALLADTCSSASIALPSGLPSSRGRIEFWVKILAPEIPLSYNPSDTFVFNAKLFNCFGEDQTELGYLNLNLSYGTSGTGFTTKIGAKTMSSCDGVGVGGLDLYGWHRFLLRWNVSGLSEDAECNLLFQVDDVVISKAQVSTSERGDFVRSLLKTREMKIASQDLPFIIDELKIWNSDVTSVELSDGVDVVDGVTWYYTLDADKATIVKGEIPYSGELTTPAKLDGHAVTAIAGGAFQGCEGLTSIVVSDGVKQIGSGAFAQCHNLVRAVLPSSATDIVESCFYECEKLTEVRLPTVLPNFCPFFLKGTAVTRVVLPSGVQTIGYCAFFQSAKMESVRLPKSLTFIDWGAFHTASSLKSVEFPAGFTGFGNYQHDTTELHAVFGKCTSLEQAIFNGHLPTGLEYTWLLQLNCKIYYPKAYEAEWSAVVPAAKFGGYSEDIVDSERKLVYHSTLDSSEAVTSPAVGLPGSCVNAIFEAGHNGNALYIPASVSPVCIPFPDGLPAEKGCIDFWAKIKVLSPNVSINGNPRFFVFNRTGKSNSSVAHLDIHSTNGVNGHGFTTVLGNLIIPSSSYPGFLGGYSYVNIMGGLDPEAWHHYTLRWNVDGLEEDPASAFMMKLDDVIISKSPLSTLDRDEFMTLMSDACDLYFPVVAGSSSYSRVPYWIDDFKVWNSDVIDEGGDLPVVDPTLDDGVDVVNGVTWYYTLADGKATIVKGAIPYAGDLVVPDSVDGHPVTEVAECVFQANVAVTSVVFPDSVKHIGGWAFDQAGNLKSVRLPAMLEYLGDSAFSYCSALTNGVLAAGLVRVEKDIFHTNKQMQRIVVPDGVKSMGRAVFYDCTSLKEVWFPESFESFDHDSNQEIHMQFGHCTALEAAYFAGPVPANLWTSGLQLYGKIYYSKKYSDAWSAVVPAEKFGGYIEDIDGGGEPVDPPAPGDLFYYTTFDSAAAIETPAVGPAGTIYNATFQDGVKGKALYVPAGTATVKIPFANGLPQRKGCIEFWAKILPSAETFSGESCPRFYLFNIPGTDVSAAMFLELTSNDGWGNSGWYLSHGATYGHSYHTCGGGLAYSDMFGGADYRDWHHYVIRWNVEGLSGQDDVSLSFELDSKTMLSCTKSSINIEKFLEPTSIPLELLFSVPYNTVNPRGNRTPFLIDEFKIWSSDVAETGTGGGDEPVEPPVVDGRLVYYSTFDSASSIETPVVGAAGTLYNASFQEGKKGNALYVSAGTATARVPFDHGLPQRKGCIEFWAKILPSSAYFGIAGNPRFFFFTLPQQLSPDVAYLELNANNGGGKSGWQLVLGGNAELSYSTYSNYLPYEQLFPDMDYRDWHHYVVRWNVDGLSDQIENALSFELDSRQMLSRAKSATDVARLLETFAKPLELMFSSTRNADVNLVPFLVDEFKVWNSDGIGSGDEPMDPTMDGVDEVNGVTWYYALADGKATIVKGAIPYAGDLTVPTTLDGHPVVAVGEGAFADCSGLTSIEVPDCIATIGRGAFGNCAALKKAVFLGHLPAKFEYSWLALLKCKIYFPREFADEWNEVVPIARFGGYAEDIGGDDPVVPPEAGKLVYYTTLDSVAAIEAPIAGPAGTCHNATFQEGKQGNALYVPAGAGVVRVPFDNGLPLRKGCIEFWAKILTNSSQFYGPGNPNFFMFNRQGYDFFPWLSLSLTTNDGGNGSGWYAAVSSFWATSIPQSSNVLDYTTVFGDADYRDWHHYMLKWNLDGVAENADKAFVGFMDDKLILSHELEGVDKELFVERLKEPLELLFAAPINTAGPRNFRMPFLIDEFKVWNSDVTGEPVVDPTLEDGIDEINGVTWYYTLVEGKATIVKGEIPYAGKLTTPKQLDGHSVVAIGDGAFIDCEGLISVTVSDGVETIGNGGFARCSNLVSASLPDSATNILESCFYECSSLTEVRLPASLPKMSAFFFKGTAVERVVIPKGVTSLEHDVFYDARKLVSVKLPTALTFLDWSAFQNASSLREIEFPPGFAGFGTLGNQLSENYAAFGHCTSLERAIFHGPPPANFDYSWLTRLNCKIYYPLQYHDEWSAVVPYANFGGYSTDDWNGDLVDDGVLDDGKAVVDGVMWYYDLARDGTVTIVSSRSNSYVGDLTTPTVLDGHPVVAIGVSAFMTCTRLTSVVVSEGVAKIGNGAFGWCANLEKVTLPNSVTNLEDSCFYECPRLAEVRLSTNLESIPPHCFENTGLTNVVIPEGVTRIAHHAFYRAEQLESVALPSTLSFVDYSAFLSTPSLKSVEFPVGFSSFGTNNGIRDVFYASFGLCGVETAIFHGPLPTNFDYSWLSQLKNCKIYYPRQFADQWSAVVSAEKFGGYTEDIGGGDDPVQPPAGDEGLVYYTTFDSAEAVEAPSVGPAGVMYNATFQEGKRGKALYVPEGTATVKVPFANGIPQREGCIEFWAKLLPTTTSLSWGGWPRYFSFNLFGTESNPAAFLELNANNGGGQSGWHLVLGGNAVLTYSSFYNYLPYETMFQGMDYLDWHHYVIRWNVDGLSGQTDNGMSFELDSVQLLSRPKSTMDAQRLVETFAQPLDLIFSVPENTVNPTNCRTPFLIDEFKIWNRDAVGGGDEPDPGPGGGDEPDPGPGGDEPDPGPGGDDEPQPTPGTLVYYSTLDSAESVTQPIVGNEGTCADAIFEDGHEGKALYIPASTSPVCIPFPNGLPAEKGCIDFWAKIKVLTPFVAFDGNPRFYCFNRTGAENSSVSHLDIHATNGVNGHGFTTVLGTLIVPSSSYPGFLGGVSYVNIMGGLDPEAWHHYTLRWNVDGLAEDRDSAFMMKLDDVIISKSPKVSLERDEFIRLLSDSCELYFPLQNGFPTYNRVPYWIDEFKVWNSDVIGTTPDPTPVVDPVPGGDDPMVDPIPGGDDPAVDPVPGGDDPAVDPVPGGDDPVVEPDPITVGQQIVFESLKDGTTVQTGLRQGVEVKVPVHFGTLENPVVKVSGLPSGMTFKNGVISGAPRSATRRNRGKLKPKKVKFTLKPPTGKKVKLFAEFTVLPRADWCVGTFNGLVSVDGACVGPATFKLAASGKGTGSFSEIREGRKRKVSMKCVSLNSYDEEKQMARLKATLKGGKVMEFSLTANEDGVGKMVTSGGTVDPSLPECAMIQNVWKAKRADAPTLLSGRKACVLALDNGLTLTLLPKGVVKISGKVAGDNGKPVAVNAKSQLLWESGREGESNASVVLFVPPKRNLSKGFLEALSLQLEKNGAGVITQAVLVVVR